MSPEADRRSNNFNLLRLILASSVIVAHSYEIIDGNRAREPAARIFGEWVTLGALAVDGFFLLSGFLIAQSWDQVSKLGPYLRKRAFRIYPGFMAASLVTGLVVGPLSGNPQYWSQFRPVPFLRGMLQLFEPRLPEVFAHLHWHGANGPLWTIRYEFAAYLGLATLGLIGLFRRRWLVLVGAIGVAAWSSAQALHLVPPIAPYRAISANDADIPRLASCFLAGTCYYLFRDRVRYKAIGAVVAMPLLVASMFREPVAAVAIPLLGGYLLLCAGLASPVPGTSAVRREDVSYGVYLYAWPIQQLIVSHWPSVEPWAMMTVTFPLSLLAGWLSWRLVEQPFLRIGRPTRQAQ